MSNKKSKIITGCLSLVGIVLIGLLIGYYFFNEKKPDTCENPVLADQWTDEIFTALNKEAWDTLAYISWSFRETNHYAWDRKNNIAIIELGDTRVVMNLDEKTGKTYQNDVLLAGDEHQKALDTAWKNWCNDSFWLSAHYKLRDPGTERCIVKTEDGKKGLMVNYTSGGTTPGDAYLWFFDENNRPSSYKMWVQIIPVGGLEVTWENWLDLDNGVMIAQDHLMKGMNISITNVKAGQTLDELGYTENPFIL